MHARPVGESGVALPAWWLLAVRLVQPVSALFCDPLGPAWMQHVLKCMFGKCKFRSQAQMGWTASNSSALSTLLVFKVMSRLTWCRAAGQHARRRLGMQALCASPA